MDRIERKAAVAACKESKASAGIYAIRCSDPDRVWVGRAPNLGAVANRVLFALRTGTHASRSLQAAFAATPEGLRFERLERIAEDAHPSSWNRLLQEKLAFWAEKLGAERL